MPGCSARSSASIWAGPFEGWENARIERELGEITGYVHERLGSPLVVPDDDISGTFVAPSRRPRSGAPGSTT